MSKQKNGEPNEETYGDRHWMRLIWPSVGVALSKLVQAIERNSAAL